MEESGFTLEIAETVKNAHSALQESNYISELHAGATDILYADKVAAVYV